MIIFDLSNNQMMKTIETIFKEAGRDTGNKANAKKINSVLSTVEGLEIQVSQEGYVWTTERGFKYNILIEYKGAWSVYRAHGTVKFYDVLVCLSKFLTKENISSMIRKELTGLCSCPKCNGSGRLTQYTHVENGLCFKCVGTGVVNK